MGRIKDLDAEMHELPDYEKGIQAERQRILEILDDLHIDYPPIIDYITEIKGESQKDNETVVLLTDGEKQMSENKYTFEEVEEWVKVGEQRELERIIQLLSNKGMELEKDVSWDDDASHIRYTFMLDILKLVRGY